MVDICTYILSVHMWVPTNVYVCLQVLSEGTQINCFHFSQKN